MPTILFSWILIASNHTPIKRYIRQSQLASWLVMTVFKNPPKDKCNKKRSKIFLFVLCPVLGIYIDHVTAVKQRQ